MLDDILDKHGRKLDHVIELEVNVDALIERITGRYTCANCGAGYHDSFKQPAVEGVCDNCGATDMKRRADDNAETVAQRLKAYHAQTAPLVAYYESNGALSRVDAMGAIDAIASELNAVVVSATA